jgi:hypothetical protein
MSASTDWQRIRLLRAKPPARVTGERVGVFVAALEQSEQLMRAAEGVGPAARPLPLFYALSQAGRAIAAARLEDPWRLAGHGIGMVPKQDHVTDPLRRVVMPKGNPGGDRRDSFAGVAAAVGSDSLSGPVELGAVWGAMPDLVEPMPQMPLDKTWRRPLEVFRHDWMSEDTFSQIYPGRFPLRMLVAGLPPDTNGAALDAELAHYPAALGAAAEISEHRAPVGTPEAVERDWSPTVEICPQFFWRGGPPASLDDVAQPHRLNGKRLLVPRLGDGEFLSPVMLWWVLLFGLSSLARYDPEEWVAALDVNASEQAVPIEAALDLAVDALPALILEALTGST